MTSQQATAILTESGTKYLTFNLDKGVYGIPILNVREIIGMQPVTPLPRMPQAIEGVINLRGKIIPVLDLRSALSLHAGAHDRATCIIVLDMEGPDQSSINVGCIVDAVREVSDVALDDVQDSPSVGSRLDSDYIQGLAKSTNSDHVITLLDTRVVLSDFMESADGFDGMEMSL